MSEARHGGNSAGHERKALGRLLRHIGGRSAQVSGEDASGVAISGRDDGAGQHFPPALVAKALSLGLIVREGESLVATAEARAFLRRALVEDPADAFLEQQRVVVPGRVEVDGAWEQVRVNLRCTPLALIARLKDRSGAQFLSPEAIEAGERLHADFTRAQLQPRVTASWEPRLASRDKTRTGGMADICDSAAAARQRVSRALEAIGPELAGVALDVCCFLKGVETVESERQWPVRSAKVILRMALNALARHYGLKRNCGGVDLRHWGADDFRPRIGG